MPDVEAATPFPAYNGTGPYIFVSYAHADGKKVFSEIAWLHEQGYRIWYDEGVDPGNEWPDEVATALEAADYFLVFISPSAVESTNVRNEINVALNKRKRFLAIHLVKTPLPPGLELRMGNIQALLRFQMETDRYRAKLLQVLPPSVNDDGPLASSRPDVSAPVPGAKAKVNKRRVALRSAAAAATVATIAVLVIALTGGPSTSTGLRTNTGSPTNPPTPSGAYYGPNCGQPALAAQGYSMCQRTSGESCPAGFIPQKASDGTDYCSNQH